MGAWKEGIVQGLRYSTAVQLESSALNFALQASRNTTNSWHDVLHNT
jgi:hypothetical protein